MNNAITFHTYNNRKGKTFIATKTGSFGQTEDKVESKESLAHLMQLVLEKGWSI